MGVGLGNLRSHTSNGNIKYRLKLLNATLRRQNFAAVEVYLDFYLITIFLFIFFLNAVLHFLFFAVIEFDECFSFLEL